MSIFSVDGRSAFRSAWPAFDCLPAPLRLPQTAAFLAEPSVRYGQFLTNYDQEFVYRFLLQAEPDMISDLEMQVTSASFRATLVSFFRDEEAELRRTRITYGMPLFMFLYGAGCVWAALGAGILDVDAALRNSIYKLPLNCRRILWPLLNFGHLSLLRGKRAAAKLTRSELERLRLIQTELREGCYDTIRAWSVGEISEQPDVMRVLDSGIALAEIAASKRGERLRNRLREYTPMDHIVDYFSRIGSVDVDIDRISESLRANAEGEPLNDVRVSVLGRMPAETADAAQRIVGALSHVPVMALWRDRITRESTASRCLELISAFALPHPQSWFRGQLPRLASMTDAELLEIVERSAELTSRPRE